MLNICSHQNDVQRLNHLQQEAELIFFLCETCQLQIIWLPVSVLFEIFVLLEWFRTNQQNVSLGIEVMFWQVLLKPHNGLFEFAILYQSNPFTLKIKKKRKKKLILTKCWSVPNNSLPLNIRNRMFKFKSNVRREICAWKKDLKTEWERRKSSQRLCHSFLFTMFLLFHGPVRPQSKCEKHLSPVVN